MVIKPARAFLWSEIPRSEIPRSEILRLPGRHGLAGLSRGSPPGAVVQEAALPQADRRCGHGRLFAGSPLRLQPPKYE